MAPKSSQKSPQTRPASQTRPSTAQKAVAGFCDSTSGKPLSLSKAADAPSSGTKRQSGNAKLKVNTAGVASTQPKAENPRANKHGSQNGDFQPTMSQRPGDLPTPKSPSPNELAAGQNTRKGAVTSTAAAHDMEAVDELLATMKRMLGALGSTFDTLGEQTIKVATVPVAIRAAYEVSRRCIDFHQSISHNFQDCCCEA